MLFAFKLLLRSFNAGNRTLARFTAVVSIVGIAAGVAAFIIAHAIGNGFRAEIQEKLVANTPNISVFAVERGPLMNTERLTELIGNIENVRATDLVRTEHILIAGPNEIEPAILYVDAASNESSVDIGNELAARIGAAADSTIELITVTGDDPGKRTRLKVGAMIKTGLFDQDSQRVNASAKVYSAITGKDFTPNGLNVSVDSIFDSDKTAAAIREKLGPEYRVIDWQEANQPLFAALALERKGGFVVIFLIIFIAVLGITTTLSLLVNERRHDIAVLRACGARSKHILEIFILEGLFLGIAGIAIGLFLGFAGCYISNKFRLISLDPEIYLINYIPLTPSVLTIAAACAITLILCLAATLYPAFLATKTHPLEDLRR